MIKVTGRYANPHMITVSSELTVNTGIEGILVDCTFEGTPTEIFNLGLALQQCSFHFLKNPQTIYWHDLVDVNYKRFHFNRTVRFKVYTDAEHEDCRIICGRGSKLDKLGVFLCGSAIRSVKDPGLLHIHKPLRLEKGHRNFGVNICFVRD